MKASLTFKLPEDADEHKHALQGLAYLMVLKDFDEHLRKLLKYSELSDRDYDIYDNLRGVLNNLAEANEVNIHD